MKKNVNLLSIATMMLFALSIILYSGCKTDDSEPVAPIASFQFVVNDTNSLEVSFTNYSKYATSYSWDFGDGIGTSTEMNPTYTYADGGVFNVTLTAFNDIGSKDHSKEVIAKNPAAQNYIKNGGFDDDSEWNIIQHNGNNNATATIADGVAFFKDVEQGDWGSEGHVGINQPIIVESGLYQLDMHITTTGLDQMWFEVWVGTDQPIEGEDYNEGNGATKVLSFNTWDCASNATYSGMMAEASCQDTDGSIELDAGDYYYVIRTGGISWGDGITIDDVSMVKVN